MSEKWSNTARKYSLDYMEKKLEPLLKDMELLATGDVHLFDYIDKLKEWGIECPMVDIHHYYLKGRKHDERKWPVLPFRFWLRFPWGIGEFMIMHPDKDNPERSNVLLSWWELYKGNRGKAIENYEFKVEEA